MKTVFQQDSADKFDDGSHKIILSAEGERLGDLIYAMFDVIINHLNESYKEIMHAIWA